MHIFLSFVHKEQKHENVARRTRPRHLTKPGDMALQTDVIYASGPCQPLGGPRRPGRPLPASALLRGQEPRRPARPASAPPRRGGSEARERSRRGISLSKRAAAHGPGARRAHRSGGGPKPAPRGAARRPAVEHLACGPPSCRCADWCSRRGCDELRRRSWAAAEALWGASVGAATGWRCSWRSWR